MRAWRWSLLSVLVFVGCSGGPDGAAADALGESSSALAWTPTCMDDSSCGPNEGCDTSLCLSCCEPGADVCLARCCGSCERIGPAAACPRAIVCRDDMQPVVDPSGCVRACRPAPRID